MPVPFPGREGARSDPPAGEARAGQSCSARHRVAWIRDDNGAWVAVLKSIHYDEIYMQSYRRANERQVERWREVRGSGGRNLPAKQMPEGTSGCT